MQQQIVIIPPQGLELSDRIIEENELSMSRNPMSHDVVEASISLSEQQAPLSHEEHEEVKSIENIQRTAQVHPAEEEKHFENIRNEQDLSLILYHGKKQTEE